MVDIEDIKWVFDKVIDEYESHDLVLKCSRKDIERKLSKLSQSEIYRELGGILNKGERDAYVYIDENYSDYMKNYGDDLDNAPQSVKDRIAELGEAKYQFEKRIFVKKESPKIPNIDRNTYVEANQNSNKFEVENSVEQSLVNQQNSELENVDFASEEYNCVTGWFSTSYQVVNPYLIKGEDSYKDSIDTSNGNEWRKEYWDKEIPHTVKNLNKVINKASGLPNNTVLYRGGKFDEALYPGAKGKFKEFLSTSFRKDVAENFQVEGREYLITVLAPKGSKGLCGSLSDGYNSTIGSVNEHEYLLPNNQQFTVVEMDRKNKTVTILLE